MNFIKYNAQTNSYSFNHLDDDSYKNLSSEGKIEYLEQRMLWALDEDWERLEELMQEAKQEVLGRYGDRD